MSGTLRSRQAFPDGQLRPFSGCRRLRAKAGGRSFSPPLAAREGQGSAAASVSGATRLWRALRGDVTFDAWRDPRRPQTFNRRTMNDSIAGYEIIARSHRGARASVYRGRDASGGDVVIELPNAEFPAPAELDRMRAEYALLQRIDHPGVARVRALVPHGNSLALVLEPVGGRTLAEYMRGGTTDLRTATRLAIGMADAIAAVHQAGIVHRGVSPHSFMVDPASATVTLTDFSAATAAPREVSAPGGSVSGAGLPWVSPEQTGRMNRSVDYRSDLYSLGATLYELLTGRPPFTAADPLQLIHQHIARAPQPPHELRADVPPALSRIVLRLLAKTAEERYRSATGVRIDLERCHAELRAGTVSDFEIGTADVPSRFHVPEKLYGREAHVAQLLAAFERVGEHGSALLLVAGDPGVGKSSLVSEVHRPIVERRGYVAAGKFDQLRRDVPFASLQQCLRGLVAQVLTESAERVAAHRERMLEACGGSGGLMLDIVPELERIIGEQPPVPELPVREAQNRFQLVLRRLIHAFCRPEHPVCLFLDDLQWVDGATLEWIEATLSDREAGHLFLMGAYRDNEVGAAHPLRLALDRLRAQSAAIEEVRLSPLPASALRSLVSDTLHRPATECEPLTAQVEAKTGGNPFFVTRLLESLHDDGAITFDGAAGRWEYDLHRVEAAAVSENVVEFLTQRIRRLTTPTLDVLRLASCVGSTFALDTLIMVTVAPRAAVLGALDEAIAHGLIARSSDPAHVDNAHYRFQHDRIQQAAYELMSDEQALHTHLHIGRLLLAALSDPLHDARIFDVLHHLNRARVLITDTAERRRLAELNLAAATRARAAAAHAPARTHVHIAAELAGEAAAARDALHFEIALEGAECEHLNGDDAAAELCYERGLALAPDDFARARVYENRIHFYTNRALFRDAYATALEAAALFGIELPPKFVPPLFVRDLLETKWRMRGRTPTDLLELPPMQDARLQLAVRFMAAVAKAAYQIRPELCVAICTKITNLSIQHGITPDSVIGFLAHGVIFVGGVMGDHGAGREWGRLVLELADRDGTGKQKAEVNFVYGYFANSWSFPLADTERYYRIAYTTGLESGDHFHASCACAATIQGMHMRGVPMDVVWAESERYLEFLHSVHTHECIGAVEAVRQTIRNLRGETRNRTSFASSEFDEDAYVRALPGYGSPHFAHFYFVDRLQALYLWGEYDAAIEAARASAAYLKSSPGLQHAAEHHFYHALTVAALAGAGARHRVAAPRALRRSRARFARWARRCPENFLHRQLLLEAEIARLAGRSDRAAKLYDQAIEAAGRHGFLQNEALAAELAGRFHLAAGRHRAARHHLREAALRYRRWGATALADALVDRYPTVLADIAVTHETRPAGTAVTPLPDAAGSESLDLMTVVRSAQALAGEVHLSALLRKLLEMVMENAGAARGVVLLRTGDELRVQAESAADGAVRVLHDAPAAEHEGIAHTVVNYVARSGEHVVLYDAREVNRFATDPYVVRARPRSILCLPLANQGRLTGVLYLENDLVAGAFTADRIHVLALLAGQIAIAIDNALLYEQLEQRVRQRTEQLETRNTLIRQTFGRYLSDEIVNSLLERPADSHLGGDKRTVTILMADLRGFTGMADALPPEQVVAVINNYLGVMTDVIFRHDGTIDEIMGDGILAVFGAPFLHHDDATRAAACAVDMQIAMATVNERNRAAGLPALELAVGLNTGEAVVGSIGSEKRAKYGVVGSCINLAARIESMAVGGQIMMSQATLDAVGADARIGGHSVVRLKGVQEPVPIHELVGIGGSYELNLERAEPPRVERLAAPVPLRYAPLDGKQVLAAVSGWLLALSPDAAEIRGGAPVQPPDSVRLELDSGSGAVHVYAKVVSGSEGADPHFTVRFTAVPDTARSLLESYLRAEPLPAQ
jgi:predicted ATPase/class 3 adenylate cyclase